MKKFYRTIFFLANILTVSLLVMSVIGAHVSPVHSSLLSFIGFAFPFFFIVNILFGIFWIVNRRKRSVFCIIALIISWGQWQNIFQFEGQSIDDIHKLHHPVSIMSYNVRMFDRFNWTGEKETPQKIYEFLKQENPDVLCIQEFFINNEIPYYSENNILSQFKQYRYKHIEYNVVTKSGRKFGLATFSKYPIIRKKPLYFENSSNFSMQTDIDINGVKVRVFNNHLESIRLKTENYHFIDSISYFNEAQRRKGIYDIFSKMNSAFASRSFQAESIGRHIRNSELPAVVCGDFNDTPVSYVYNTVKGELKDAFVESGVGMGGTYHGNLPSFRIDYIFHDKAFKSYNFKRIKVDYSDHYPIQTILELQPL